MTAFAIGIGQFPKNKNKLYTILIIAFPNKHAIGLRVLSKTPTFLVSKRGRHRSAHSMVSKDTSLSCADDL